MEAVESDGDAYTRCTVCHWRFGGYTEDPKHRSLVREHSVPDLNPLNVDGPIDGVVAREFVCPGCGTLIGIDIQRPDDPLLREAILGTRDHVSP